MKLFLALLFVAGCQATDLLDTKSFETKKELELNSFIKATEVEMFDKLKKAYPNEDPKVLQELAYEFTLLIKSEIDLAMSLLGKGTELATKLVNNMIKNMKKAEAGGADSAAETAKALFDEMSRDMDELKEYNENSLYWESHFDVASDVILFKIQYGLWDTLNDTLHRIIGHLSGKFSDLKEFFKKTIKAGSEKLHPHLVNVKQLAKDLLANIGFIHRNVAQQALEFFKPFAKQLGSLYINLREKIHQRFHDLANPGIY